MGMRQELGWQKGQQRTRRRRRKVAHPTPKHSSMAGADSGDSQAAGLTMGAGTMPPMNMAGEAAGGPPAMGGPAIMPGGMPGGIIMGPNPGTARAAGRAAFVRLGCKGWEDGRLAAGKHPQLAHATGANHSCLSYAHAATPSSTCCRPPAAALQQPRRSPAMGMPKGAMPIGAMPAAAAAAMASALSSAADLARLGPGGSALPLLPLAGTPLAPGLRLRLRPARAAPAARTASPSSAVATRLGSLGGSCASPGRQP